MSVGKGLAGIRKAKEEAALRREQMSQAKVEWFTLKGRPNGARIKFLQELDEVGLNYLPDRGTFITVLEHQAPGKEGWKARAMCTNEEEGRCFACERHSENPGEGWKAKTNMYINILDEDGVVKVLSRNVNNSFVDTLVEWFDSTGTITDSTFKLKETGEGFNRTWTMTPAQPLDANVGELYELEKVVVRKIPYSDQRDYYMRVYNPIEKTEEKTELDEALSW
jgi:hypothetical protein